MTEEGQGENKTGPSRVVSFNVPGTLLSLFFFNLGVLRILTYILKHRPEKGFSPVYILAVI